MDDNDKLENQKNYEKEMATFRRLETREPKYSATKVKTRNILTNLSYLRVNKLDFDKKSYLIDSVTFIIQYLNVFSLDLKLETELEKNMLMFIWQNCLPRRLTEFVSSKDHYDTITSPNTKFKDVYLIVKDYMSNEANYVEARELFKSYFDEIRYVFAFLFPKIYSRTNESGKQIKRKFDFSFSLWINNTYVKNNTNNTGKDIETYNEREDSTINEFEQKPLKNELIDVIDVLNECESQKTENKETVTVTVNESNVVNKVKPINEIKKNFSNERQKRKHEKLMKKKAHLEEQLKKNTEQWNLLKPLFKKKKFM